MKFEPLKPHNLANLPPAFDYKTDAVWVALSNARAELAELKGYSSKLNNPMVLLFLILLEEAVESNRIEDIHTTVESALKSQIEKNSNRKGPEKERENYNEALSWGMKHQKKYSLSTRLILGIHKTLLKTSRGYRQQQNTIRNTRTGNIIYTPPVVPAINELIQNWEKFVNHWDEDRNYSLIKCAIAHYQFEAIHPFIDGNGRTGRILLALHLAQENFLEFPVLYTSAYLSQHQTEYYEVLKGVTEEGDWEQYVLFMLEAFRIQSVKTKEKLFQMETLYNSLVSELEVKHPKLNAQKVADHIFRWPYTTPTTYAKALTVHIQTGSAHLKELSASGILEDRWEGKNHVFGYPPLINL